VRGLGQSPDLIVRKLCCLQVVCSVSSFTRSTGNSWLLSGPSTVFSHDKSVKYRMNPSRFDRCFALLAKISDQQTVRNEEMSGRGSTRKPQSTMSWRTFGRAVNDVASRGRGSADATICLSQHDGTAQKVDRCNFNNGLGSFFKMLCGQR
jgi:hypothetical protein